MMTLSNDDIGVLGRLRARHLPSALPTTILTSAGAEQEVDRQVYIFLSSDNGDHYMWGRVFSYGVFPAFVSDVVKNHVHKMHKIKLYAINALHTKRFITPFNTLDGA